MQVLEAAIDATDDTAITCGDKHAIGYLPVELLGYFQSNRLLALNKIGVITRVAIVPAKDLARLDTEIKGVIVAPLHGKDGRATHQQLHNFGTRRVVRHEDIAGQTDRGRLHSQRRGSITRRGAGHRSSLR